MGEDGIASVPGGHSALCVAAAGGALAGPDDEANRLIARLLGNRPALRISNLKNVTGPTRREFSARYADALRKAGLPN